MKLFDVYPRNAINLVKAEGSWVWDESNQKYLDMYGGHAVISIGHSHPYYMSMLTEQLGKIGFYSNSVLMPIQNELAAKLGEYSGYSDYKLFLCNSGAEANENALKAASFHNGRKKIIAFEGAFHGRTSLAVAITDNPKIQAPVNESDQIVRIPLNDLEALEKALDGTIAAVIIEGIQGVNGIRVPDDDFLRELSIRTRKNGAVLIVDEVQSGYGRSGKFFAHQYADIQPDIITLAKGMGNGFPIAGVMISPKIKSWHGMLGTTFGGNHLACAAGIAVLDVIDAEKLIGHSEEIGNQLMYRLSEITGVSEVRGRGLMIGVDLNVDGGKVRRSLLEKHNVLVGSSNGPNTIRILPPLTVSQEEIDLFVNSFQTVMQHETLSIGG